MKKVKEMILYEVRCWWDDDTTDMCTKYIVAKDDEECEMKMQQYAKQLKEKGFAKLNWLPDSFIVDNYCVVC